VSLTNAEGDKGTLSPGELAQFTVLAASPTADTRIANLRIRSPSSLQMPDQEGTSPSPELRAGRAVTHEARAEPAVEFVESQANVRVDTIDPAAHVTGG
jgi:hypothetical protein